MSEEKPKRNFRRRRPNNNRSKTSEGTGSTPSTGSNSNSDPSSDTNKTKTSNSNTNTRNGNRRRGGTQRGERGSNINARPSGSKNVPKEETRDADITLLNHRIAIVPEVKLINSHNKAKIYSATFDDTKESYKITVPIIKRLPIQLQSFPEKPANPNVIKNFNSKVKANDKSLLFYFNLLVNDIHHLAVKPEDYKLYNMTKAPQVLLEDETRTESTATPSTQSLESTTATSTTPV